MTQNKNPLPDGATDLDPDEVADLLPGVSTRAELNAFEQANIAQALSWAISSTALRKNLLTINSLKKLHRNMFADTWRWAGKFRTSGKNIGVEPHLIQNELGNLCNDGQYWLNNKTFSLEVCAIRFHHRLVSIHPFPNGNGRHARLVADLIMRLNGKAPFTWGGESIDAEGRTRNEYLEALRAADKGKYQKLIDFAQK